MNAHAFPFALHWDAHDLAGAVPRRLHELPEFAVPLVRAPASATHAAAAPPLHTLRRPLRGDYACGTPGACDRFHIH
jgi:hypothetical protein